jgi:hypothetical protein
MWAKWAGQWAMVLGGLGLLAGPARAACDVTLKPDGNTAAIQHAMDKESKRPVQVCLNPGVYRGARLVATRSVVLRRLGKDKVVLDAGGQGRVLTIPQAGITVVLDGITLTNGKADRGGAVALVQASKLELTDCWIYNNTATLLGGGAISASAGELHLVRTRITSNYGERASAIDLSGSVKARLASTLVADNEAKGSADPPIRLSSAAQLDLYASTVAYNGGSGIVLQPDGPGRRKLSVSSSIVMGKPDAITVQRAEVDDVRVDRSILWGGIGWVALDMVSKKSLPGFNLKELERYRPEIGSVAIGTGLCTPADARKDLAGLPRASACTAGALEAPAADIRATLAARKKDPKAQKPTSWQQL